MRSATRPRTLALRLLAMVALGGCAARAPASKAPESATGADAPAAEAARKEEPAMAAPGPPPPPAPPPEEPKPMEQVEQEATDPARAFADAEALLDVSLTRKKSERLSADGATPPAKRDDGADSCSVACRALASMRRSADRLCELSPSASPDAPRCDDARDRVDRAARRVRERCPSCASAP